ncbi:F0F1 ATP synthase subunit A [Patulibacter sp. S7RM1-6]
MKLRHRALMAATPLVAALAAPALASAADEFKPDAEFDVSDPLIGPHIEIAGIDLSISKAVLYVLLAGLLTVLTLVLIARRMQAHPNGRAQTVVEWAYEFVDSTIVGDNIDSKKTARTWFPFIATLFFFIYFSNVLGYLPLPTNQEHTFSVFGADIPAFALYAATANISMPLILALVVWISYNVVGIRKHGLFGYVKGLVPGGLPWWILPLMYPIEILSHFVRLISLSLRLYANILAGHLLILFMAGGLVVLLEPGWVGAGILGIATAAIAVVFFLFELTLVAALQAFIFSTLTAIYIGGAVAEEH